MSMEFDANTDTGHLDAKAQAVMDGDSLSAQEEVLPEANDYEDELLRHGIALAPERQAEAVCSVENETSEGRDAGERIVGDIFEATGVDDLAVAIEREAAARLAEARRIVTEAFEQQRETTVFSLPLFELEESGIDFLRNDAGFSPDTKNFSSRIKPIHVTENGTLTFWEAEAIFAEDPNELQYVLDVVNHPDVVDIFANLQGEELVSLIFAVDGDGDDVTFMIEVGEFDADDHYEIKRVYGANEHGASELVMDEGESAGLYIINSDEDPFVALMAQFNIHVAMGDVILVGKQDISNTNELEVRSILVIDPETGEGRTKRVVVDGEELPEEMIGRVDELATAVPIIYGGGNPEVVSGVRGEQIVVEVANSFPESARVTNPSGTFEINMSRQAMQEANVSSVRVDENVMEDAFQLILEDVYEAADRPIGTEIILEGYHEREEQNRISGTIDSISNRVVSRSEFGVIRSRLEDQNVSFTVAYYKNDSRAIMFFNDRELIIITKGSSFEGATNANMQQVLLTNYFVTAYNRLKQAAGEGQGRVSQVKTNGTPIANTLGAYTDYNNTYIDYDSGQPVSQAIPEDTQTRRFLSFRGKPILDLQGNTI